jgi:hypothetical protein
MSLINEALKKAQRMRHQDPAGAPPPATDAAAGQSVPPATSMPMRRGRTPASQTLLLFAGVPLLVLISVGATWWLLRPSPSEEAPVIARADTPAPAAQPAAGPATNPAPPVEVQPTAAPEPVISVASTPATPAASTAQAPEPVGLPAPPPPPPAAEQAPAPALALSDPAQSSKPDSRVHAFLDTLRVTGIRSSETDPRVSMNGRVFRLNDIVDRNLELRIIGIAPEGLTFIGPNGVVYQTQF